MNKVLPVSQMLIALGGLSLRRSCREKTSPWQGGESTLIHHDSGES